MIDNEPSNVSAAFEILQEQIEAEINVIDKAGSRAFEEHDHRSAREALELGDKINAFRDKVVLLHKEWEALAETFSSVKNVEIASVERTAGRLPRGERTPEKAYYLPILKVLDKAGGSAKINAVLAEVELLMKDVLKQVDYQSVPSDPDLKRWNSTARFARHSMVKEGLLKSNSDWGVWEISEAGRKYLAGSKQ
jgi:restriction system protein